MRPHQHCPQWLHGLKAFNIAEDFFFLFLLFHEAVEHQGLILKIVGLFALPIICLLPRFHIIKLRFHILPENNVVLYGCLLPLKIAEDQYRHHIKPKQYCIADYKLVGNFGSKVVNP